MQNAVDGETTISLGSAFVNQNILNDDAEMLMIFKWDGISDIVQDVDYFIWGNTNEGIDKTVEWLRDNHPNIVKIFEVGNDGDTHFMSFEYLPESLDNIIKASSPMIVNSVVKFGQQILHMMN